MAKPGIMVWRAAAALSVSARIPGLGTAFKALTLVLPLGRGHVVERNDTLFVE